MGQYLFFLTLNVVATLAQHVTIRLLARYLLGTPNLVAETEMANGHSRTSSQATATAKDNTANHIRHISSDPTSPTSTAGLPQFDTNFHATPRPGFATPSAISTALLVSSCTKLFPILLVIWPTSSADAGFSGLFASRAASYIGWVVLVNNIEALLILLDCGYLLATSLAVAGMISRFMVEGWLLALVGLQKDGSGPVGDFLSLLQYARGGLG